LAIAKIQIKTRVFILGSGYIYTEIVMSNYSLRQTTAAKACKGKLLLFSEKVLKTKKAHPYR